MHTNQTSGLLPGLLPTPSAEIRHDADGALYLRQRSPRVVITRIEGYFTRQAESLLREALKG